MSHCYKCEDEYTTDEMYECTGCAEFFCRSCFNTDYDVCESCDTVDCADCGNAVSREESHYCDECYEDFCGEHWGSGRCIECEWNQINDKLSEYLAETKYPSEHLKEWHTFLRAGDSSYNIDEYTENDILALCYTEWRETISEPENENMPIGKIIWVSQ